MHSESFLFCIVLHLITLHLDFYCFLFFCLLLSRGCCEVATKTDQFGAMFIGFKFERKFSFFVEGLVSELVSRSSAHSHLAELLYFHWECLVYENPYHPYEWHGLFAVACTVNLDSPVSRLPINTVDGFVSAADWLARLWLASLLKPNSGSQ